MSAPDIHPSEWALPPRGDKVFNLSISCNTLIAFIGSILLHLALLWLFAPKLFSMSVPKQDAPPFEITLGPPQQKESTQVEPEVALPPPMPMPVPTPAKPKVKKTMKQKSVPPKQVNPAQVPVEVAKKSDLTLPKNPEKPVDTSPDPLPGEDMQAYIKRQKEAKLAQQGASKQDREEILASNRQPSEGEKRDAKIKENLKFDGTNGIFQVRDIGLHSAQFSFRGWKNNINTARLEIIDVPVPDGADARRVVVRKMIEIIRREYSGDFNWDSYRLGRVLVLSARPQDNDALEDFLITEFFGSGTQPR